MLCPTSTSGITNAIACCCIGGQRKRWRWGRSWRRRRRRGGRCAPCATNIDSAPGQAYEQQQGTKAQNKAPEHVFSSNDHHYVRSSLICFMNKDMYMHACTITSLTSRWCVLLSLNLMQDDHHLLSVTTRRYR